MNRAGLGSLLLVVIFGTVWLHIQALQNSWYYHYPFSDIPMHILGGALAALLTLFIANTWNKTPPTLAAEWGLVILWTFVVALAWEVFELLFNIYAASNYIEDTLMDIAMGFLGAGIIMVITHIKHRHAQHISS